METFVELADTLASDYEVGEFLYFLVYRCSALMAADTAGVLLESPTGELRLAAAVSDEMREIEDLEIALGQGPCLEAYRTGRQVIAEDLERCFDRWPAITPKLLELGMRSAYAFPLRLREDRLGALNLYRSAPGPFAADDARLAQAFADVAAIGILQERKVTAAEQRAAQLQHALDSRVIIEQAKGVLAQRHGIGPEEAFKMLRREARNKQRGIHDLAGEIVGGQDRVTEGGSSA